ncbi:MAG: SDR family NAD(P)-dependent oxidoreductase [Proteiniphilum sp.]|jgi:NAD(P)-dependent dehydrogenase (short-subunit alcohol dehydrogenase family)|nr:SDR family NAD(P)-dependent oxidoreductase [Proteiniphilum sp.]
MEKKIIFITGANRGIGKETATGLAKQGHHLVLHGRNKALLQDVSEEIKTATGNNEVDIIMADLYSLADVKRMTDAFKSRYERLDVLINNAGAMLGRHREVTSEGNEKTMTINLFAPFLIMHAMKPVLLKSDSPRIINVSSAMHRYGGRPDFNDFQFEKNYSPMRAYSLSKLYLIWVTRHLDSQLKMRGVDNVTVNTLHPGAVATNFAQDADKGFMINQIYKFALRFMDKPVDGAKTSIYLATSPDVKNVSGAYFSKKGKIEKANDRYWSPENEKLIWDYCSGIIKKY